MTNSSLMGCGAFLLYIAFFSITGTISFNVVEPHSFIGILIFLVVWGIVQFVGQAILAVLFSLLAR
jgi:hypothetical protein